MSECLCKMVLHPDTEFETNNEFDDIPELVEVILPSHNAPVNGLSNTELHTDVMSVSNILTVVQYYYDTSSEYITCHETMENGLTRFSLEPIRRIESIPVLPANGTEVRMI